MELHQVRYFLAVASTLNFTRAAEQCNVSQPALTRAIQQLEDELSDLREELERSERRVEAMKQIGRALGSNLQLDPLLSEIVARTG